MVMAAFSYGPWIGYWSGFYAAQDLGCLVFPSAASRPINASTHC
jgi:hypothetical protein